MTRAGDPVRTRALLITAARELIAERGVASATIEMISRRAGVTRGAFYYSFPSKEALLADVAQDLRIDLISLDVDLATVSAAEVSETLHAALIRSRESLLLQLELWLYAIRTPELKSLLGATTRKNLDEIAGRLSFTADPARSALTAQSVIMGISLLMLLDDSLAVDEVTAAFDVVVSALRPKKGTARSSR